MTDIELYNAAKEAYYNGTPIMEDFEFDELEKRLGLENKSYVGAKHNPSYTVQHPFIMGSLSKEQIKKSDDGTINWTKYVHNITNAVIGDYNYKEVIATPKYDGCSFELRVTNGVIRSISSRGDGEFGKDFYMHLIGKFKNARYLIPDANDYVLRGEVLIDKNVFAQKYSEFVNPRSFVSGVLNRDYDANDADFINMLNDLSVVVYYVAINNDGSWYDVDWTRYIDVIAYLPTFYKIFQFGWGSWNPKSTNIENIYNEFVQYRQECEFALDGIVFKPTDEVRENNTTLARPKDCIAIKFVPMLEETEVIDIIWSTKKTNELRPVIIVNQVEMDGKQISKASAHNYGYLIDNKVSIGSKVILSLAGDIIPFIYKITNTDNFNVNKLGLDDNIETYQDGCHLYQKLTVEEENKLKFIASAAALNIPSIGPAAAETIYEYMVNECKGDDFFGIPAKETPNNILLVNPGDVNRALGGKSGQNAMKAMNEYIKNITVKDIIVSCTFESCGNRVATQIEKQMIYGNADFEHLASKAYNWCFNKESKENIQVNNIMNFIGLSIDDYKTVADARIENSAEQIPVILTGEPNNYDSKGAFLKAHPEYRMTGSWKEVKIVFTNDLSSTTGKMKKAIEKGIEIRIY